MNMTWLNIFLLISSIYFSASFCPSTLSQPYCLCTTSRLFLHQSKELWYIYFNCCFYFLISSTSTRNLVLLSPSVLDQGNHNQSFTTVQAESWLLAWKFCLTFHNPWGLSWELFHRTHISWNFFRYSPPWYVLDNFWLVSFALVFSSAHLEMFSNTESSITYVHLSRMTE